MKDNNLKKNRIMDKKDNCKFKLNYNYTVNTGVVLKRERTLLNNVRYSHTQTGAHLQERTTNRTTCSSSVTAGLFFVSKFLFPNSLCTSLANTAGSLSLKVLYLLIDTYK